VRLVADAVLGLGALPTYKRNNLSSMALGKKYRSHFEITALMLEIIRANGATRFFIMERSGINCAQLKKYLESLVETGLVDTGMEDGRIIYRASSKGLEFLRHYYVLLEMLLSTRASEKLPTLIYGVRITTPKSRDLPKQRL
jgi:predicted transcriptional regulator